MTLVIPLKACSTIDSSKANYYIFQKDSVLNFNSLNSKVLLTGNVILKTIFMKTKQTSAVTANWGGFLLFSC